MKLKRTKCSVIAIIVFICYFSFNAMAADLTWQTSKQTAINLATQQGKKILLLAGRST